MAEAEIGIIGGSGLYKMDVLKDVAEVEATTSFGTPSDALILGTLAGTRVVLFLLATDAITLFYPLSCRSGLIFMR